MNALIILDYSDCSVHLYAIDSKAVVDAVYIEALGYKESTCEWMYGENMNIIFHKEILK